MFETTNQVENMSDDGSQNVCPNICQIDRQNARQHDICHGGDHTKYKKKSDSCWLCLCNIWELQPCHGGMVSARFRSSNLTNAVRGSTMFFSCRVVFAVFGSQSVEFCMVFAALRGQRMLAAVTLHLAGNLHDFEARTCQIKWGFSKRPCQQNISYRP